MASIDVQDAGDNVPTIRFLEGQVTGTTGCNSFRGTYTVNGSDLTLSPLATTLVGCPAPLDAVERQILDRLARVTSYEVASARLNLRDGDETVLLYDESQATIEGAWVAIERPVRRRHPLGRPRQRAHGRVHRGRHRLGLGRVQPLQRRVHRHGRGDLDRPPHLDPDGL